MSQDAEIDDAEHARIKQGQTGNKISVLSDLVDVNNNASTPP